MSFQKSFTMTSRTSSKSKVARGASSSKTRENINSNEKTRKKSVTPKNNLQKNHQDSSTLSPGRNNNSLGCNQITPNSGQTKKNQLTENNEDKSEGTFSIGIGDKMYQRKREEIRLDCRGQRKPEKWIRLNKFTNLRKSKTLLSRSILTYL